MTTVPPPRRAMDREIIAALHDVGMVRGEVGAIKAAVFGEPLDRSDDGLKGDVRDVKRLLVRLLLVTLGGTITIVGSILSLLLFR